MQTMNENISLEDRLKNIEQNTIKDLNSRIGVLLQNKQQRALAGGFVVGTAVAALVGWKIRGRRKSKRRGWRKNQEMWAIGSGFASSMLTSKLLLSAQLR
jgi:hypothetical protein